MVMFDSLNRHMLPPYNAQTFVHAPNFARLAQRTATFERSYVCSMPCMPARRDLHTGRPNFLHRSWGPIEPFDDSVPEMLKKAGVYTHLATDHYHYFEDGAMTYHGRYSTWEFFRGQEGDAWHGMVGDPARPQCVGRQGADNKWIKQDWKNRSIMRTEDRQPQPQTFGAGLDFIRRNHGQDNWFLQIETFDPHEPFFSQQKYKDLYAEHYDRYRRMGGKFIDWPNYAAVNESPEVVEHLRCEYAALMSMCDVYMGRVLDIFDELNLWDDTMLIVWTDHGFLLSEHGCWAKCWMPFYEEVSHTPFFVWDPRPRKSGIEIAGMRRQSLVQPSIDLGPTLLEYFGVERTPDMLGCPLREAIADDKPVREAAMFGIFGGQVNVTDGRYVYMRGRANEDNQPLYEYTFMPTGHGGIFPLNHMHRLEGLAEPFSFTKGTRPMKFASAVNIKSHPEVAKTLLFDLVRDPGQTSPIIDEAVEKNMVRHLVRLMKACDAPREQFERLGLEL